MEHDRRSGGVVAGPAVRTGGRQSRQGDPRGDLGMVFDDLEQQAEGLALRERDGEVDDLGAAAYAEVDLASRLHASPGARVRVHLVDATVLRGRVVRVGRDFCLLEDGAGEVLVRVTGIARVGGLSPRSATERARPVPARLSLAGMLRRLATAHADCLVQMLGGDRVEGVVGRVGADFFELLESGGTAEVVPTASVTAIRVRR